MTALADNLFVALQRVLPTRLLGRIVYRLSRSRRRWLKNALIRWFAGAYEVDITENALPELSDYPSFNAFFTRELKAGARPFDRSDAAICCPADGTLQQIGRLRGGEMLQAKGMWYRLGDLLGAEPREIAALDNGAFVTIYLAPRNYHRVHMPIDGTIRGMRHLPGKRLAVNRATARSVPGLFAGNERLAVRCEGACGDYWIVFVGALNVASISVAWAGEVLPHADGKAVSLASDAPAIGLHKGDYCGHFNMGSTVILVMPEDSATWDATLAPGTPVRVGQRIGALAR